MYPVRNHKYIDILVFAASSTSQGGLNTIDVQSLCLYQQIIIYLVTLLTTPIFIHSTLAFVRLYWFERYFDGIRDWSEKNFKMRRTRTILQREMTNKNINNNGFGFNDGHHKRDTHFNRYFTHTMTQPISLHSNIRTSQRRTQTRNHNSNRKNGKLGSTRNTYNANNIHANTNDNNSRNELTTTNNNDNTNDDFQARLFRGEMVCREENDDEDEVETGKNLTNKTNIDKNIATPDDGSKLHHKIAIKFSDNDNINNQRSGITFADSPVPRKRNKRYNQINNRPRMSRSMSNASSINSFRFPNKYRPTMPTLPTKKLKAKLPNSPKMYEKFKHRRKSHDINPADMYRSISMLRKQNKKHKYNRNKVKGITDNSDSDVATTNAEDDEDNDDEDDDDDDDINEPALVIRGPNDATSDSTVLNSDDVFTSDGNDNYRTDEDVDNVDKSSQNENINDGDGIESIHNDKSNNGGYIHADNTNDHYTDNDSKGYHNVSAYDGKQLVSDGNIREYEHHLQKYEHNNAPHKDNNSTYLPPNNYGAEPTIHFNVPKQTRRITKNGNSAPNNTGTTNKELGFIRKVLSIGSDKNTGRNSDSDHIFSHNYEDNHSRENSDFVKHEDEDRASKYREYDYEDTNYLKEHGSSVPILNQDISRARTGLAFPSSAINHSTTTVANTNTEQDHGSSNGNTGIRLHKRSNTLQFVDPEELDLLTQDPEFQREIYYKWKEEKKRAKRMKRNSYNHGQPFFNNMDLNSVNTKYRGYGDNKYHNALNQMKRQLTSLTSHHHLINNNAEDSNSENDENEDTGEEDEEEDDDNEDDEDDDDDNNDEYIDLESLDTKDAQEDYLPRSELKYSFTNNPAFVVGRNSTFVGLSDDQKKELGGVEYSSIKILCKVLVVYYIGFNILAFVMFVPWIDNLKTNAARKYQRILKDDAISPTWWAFFTSMSSFSDLGLTLTPDSMSSFNHASYILIVMIVLIIIGNTGFPITLRWIIWALYKLSPDLSPRKESFRFLLDHPRRCFTLLFPNAPTWWLLLTLVFLNGFDWIMFLILDFRSSLGKNLGNGWYRVLNGLFQGVSTRTAGFTSMSLSELHPAVQVSYLVMMYVSVMPLAISIRRTNVYEETSLGIMANAEPNAKNTLDQAEEYDEAEENRNEDAINSAEDAHNQESTKSFIGAHLRKQLSFDLWFIFLGLFLLCIIEGRRIKDVNEPYFNIWQILFEVISAYGNVGLSLGYPNSNQSFSAQFSTLGKLIIVALLIRGKHRGLPYKLDRAIMLPSDKLRKFDRLEELKNNPTSLSDNFSKTHTNMSVNRSASNYNNRYIDDENNNNYDKEISLARTRSRDPVLEYLKRKRNNFRANFSHTSAAVLNSTKNLNHDQSERSYSNRHRRNGTYGQRLNHYNTSGYDGDYDEEWSDQDHQNSEQERLSRNDDFFQNIEDIDDDNNYENFESRSIANGELPQIHHVRKDAESESSSNTSENNKKNQHNGENVTFKLTKTNHSL
ncbi:uncharacterized protein SCODWIG_00506 [Saccharomycodes ludwigii]|uniref:Potassium transport protein n=1 Tax=Saccharomycodes ludwigii TaxID=36035 RepID=A0A376B230_9ASCO|nr:uncharacterized protein SCODWIG_00506 [Saccharomycodes ludwigii]